MWRTHEKCERDGGTKCRVKVHTQGSVDKMVGVLRDVLKDILVAAMSAGIDDKDARKMNDFK